MMEFVLSRATLVICGVILLSAVAVPMENLFEADERESISDLAESAASIIDMFYQSDMDEMYIRGSEILPSQSSYITAEGHSLTLHTDNRDYLAVTSCLTSGITISYGEITTLEKEGDTVTGRRTCPRPLSERRRTCRCPRGCCRDTRMPWHFRGYRGNRNRNGHSASPNGS